MDEHTVGEVARLSGVSVRTLHHYDAIGLLVPGARTPAGYRLYSGGDLERLRQILFYRELDFGLDEITAILADPDGHDDHLRRQHRLLRERRDRTRTLLEAIEREMEARRMGISLTPEEQFEIFGTTTLAAQTAEAEQRWGESDAWKQSRRRTATYTKDDWVAIKAEADASIAGFAAALRAGEAADGAVATALAEAHREHLTRWFYACDHRQHRALAALYVSDPRYLESWDEVAPGFSRYVHDAILANADRAVGLDEHELVALAENLPGVVVVTAGEADGSPPEARGDRFAFYDPDRDQPVDRRLPFATIVHHDVAGFDGASNLSRPGAFRLNLAVGRERFAQLVGYPPSDHDRHRDEHDYAALDRLLPHPAYATQAWVSILNPGPATAGRARALLAEAHERARARHRPAG